MLKPESEWEAEDKAEIERQVRDQLSQLPGIALGLSQPIAMRVDELASGVRSQVAVKLFGDDLETLRVKADEVARVLREVRGLSDLRVEQVSGLYYLKLDIDRAKIARHGINVAAITEVIEAVGGGIPAGEIFEGQWRFPIVVRFPDDRRADVETVASLWVTTPDGSRIPLRELADIHIVEGPAQISREQASRRIVIEAMMGLAPLLLATGPGSEIQRPLATVVIGGLFSSTVLTLIVLPVLYRWMEARVDRERVKQASVSAVESGLTESRVDRPTPVGEIWPQVSMQGERVGSRAARRDTALGLTMDEGGDRV